MRAPPLLPPEEGSGSGGAIIPVSSPLQHDGTLLLEHVPLLELEMESSSSSSSSSFSSSPLRPHFSHELHVGLLLLCPPPLSSSPLAVEKEILFGLVLKSTPAAALIGRLCLRMISSSEYLFTVMLVAVASEEVFLLDGVVVTEAKKCGGEEEDDFSEVWFRIVVAPLVPVAGSMVVVGAGEVEEGTPPPTVVIALAVVLAATVAAAVLLSTRLEDFAEASVGASSEIGQKQS